VLPHLASLVDLKLPIAIESKQLCVSVSSLSLTSLRIHSDIIRLFDGLRLRFLSELTIDGSLCFALLKPATYNETLLIIREH